MRATCTSIQNDILMLRHMSTNTANLRLIMTVSARDSIVRQYLINFAEISGAYQCFHLNYLVDKEFNSAINPYVQSNTSLMELVHNTDCTWFEFGNFEEYLKGEIRTLEHAFQLHGKNWYGNFILGLVSNVLIRKLTLKYASPEISFLMLKKEPDDAQEMQDPFYCPKTFVNFTIVCQNREDMYFLLGTPTKYRHSCDYVMGKYIRKIPDLIS